MPMYIYIIQGYPNLERLSTEKSLRDNNYYDSLLASLTVFQFINIITVIFF